MTAEEKKVIAKEFYDKLGLTNYNLEVERDNEINADFVWVPDMRGPGGLIIGDNGDYLFCQSMHDFNYWKEEYKKGTRTSTGNDDSLKLSNGKYAEDEETKEAFEGYMSKVDKYNEQVANGEKPDVKMGDLLNEYSDTFYDESLEEKIKKSENEFNKREKDTKIDNLISSIDKKISELDNNISFEKAKKIADEKAKEWNKVVVSISENNEYWLFNADNDSHPIDDGAGSCYISKKDGSIRPLNRWDIEFTKKFDETAKDLLVRTSLSELYGYHSKNNINDEKSALEYIDNISKAFLKYTFKPDNNFIFLGRKKIIYDEINDILKGNKEVDNPIYFVLGSLEEFICNNNFVYMSDGDQWEKGWEDLRNRNDIYSAMNVICLEEKNIIDNIISEIKNYIKTRTTL